MIHSFWDTDFVVQKTVFKITHQFRLCTKMLIKLEVFSPVVYKKTLNQNKVLSDLEKNKPEYSIVLTYSPESMI